METAIIEATTDEQIELPALLTKHSARAKTKAFVALTKPRSTLR